MEIWTAASNELCKAILELQKDQFKLLRSLLPHIDTCANSNPGNWGPDTYGMVIDMGWLYRQVGHWEKAARLSELWLHANRDILGEESEDVYVMMKLLHADYRQLGRHHQYQEISKQIIHIGTMVFEDDEEFLVALIIQTAWLYELEKIRFWVEPTSASEKQKLESHWEEALKWLQKIADQRGKELGAEHPTSLIAMSNLSKVHCAFRHKQDALELQKRVFVARNKRLGEEHSDTLDSMEELAGVYTSFEDHPEEAIQILERIVEIYNRGSIEARPVIVSAMSSLSLCYYYLGLIEHMQESIQLAEQAVKLSKEIFGEEHSSTRKYKTLAMQVQYGEPWSREKRISKLWRLFLRFWKGRSISKLLRDAQADDAKLRESS